MRIVAIAASLIATTFLAAISMTALSRPSDSESTTNNTFFTDVLSTRDKVLLDEFTTSLDPEIIRQCVDEYEQDGTMSVDLLATSGDFDAYARYLRVSKFEAVKKFQHALLNSSSKLEFDHRVAR